jgi:hypothetical protein
MFNSTVLEVAIGLVFCFASVALIASSIYEAIASWLNLRSATLLTGISHLLNANEDDADNQALLVKLYNDALVHPAGAGTATDVKGDIKKDKCIPSYIPPQNFALALIHAIQSVPGKFDELASDIANIKDDQLRNLLMVLYNKTNGDLERFQHEVASWFDAGMGRVSGIYKKWSQFWCFFIALVIAVVFNIDSVHLFSTLWLHPSLVAQIGVDNSAIASDAYAQLKLLPIGWNNGFEVGMLMEPRLIVGWLVTASASLFGAPFWFDTLKTLVRLRGTGTKPIDQPPHRTTEPAAKA